MINANLIKQDENLIVYNVFKDLKILGIENITELNNVNNGKITIPDKNDYIPKGYY